jgi:hypothetical protein
MQLSLGQHLGQQLHLSFLPNHTMQQKDLRNSPWVALFYFPTAKKAAKSCG